MPAVKDVCRHIRSKNAGPFWITVDLFFRDAEAFRKYADSPGLQPASIAGVFGADEKMVKRFLAPDLLVLKISYPRGAAQGGVVERDMHAGQQFVRLLDASL